MRRALLWLLITLATCQAGIEDTARYIRVPVKIGSPGTKWKSWREGMIPEYRIVLKDTVADTVVSGCKTFGKIGDKAFLAVDIPYDADTLDSVKAWTRPHWEYKPNGDINTNKSRARFRLLPLDSIANAAFKTKQARDSAVNDWRTTSKALKPLTLKTGPPKRVDPSTVAVADLPAAVDKHAVSSGSYDIPGDYNSHANAFADVAGLTGNLTFTQVSDVTETAPATITENLNGYTFTVTVGDGDWHYGNSARGYAIYIQHTSNAFVDAVGNNGTFIIERIRGIRLTAGDIARRGLVAAAGCAAHALHVRQCSYDGNGLQGCGIFINDSDPTVYVYDCVVWDCGDEGFDITSANASNQYQNNDVLGCSVGFNFNSNGGTVRRCAAYDNTTDFDNLANATGYSNASDDATAADGNWGTGASNLSGRSTSDFVSVDSKRPDYLRPVYGGGLADPDTTTKLADNTTGLAGRSWSTYGDYIGARVGLPPPSLPSGSAWRIRQSTYALPLRIPFEALHDTLVRVPRLFTDSCFGPHADTLFAHVGQDSSDLCLSDTAGREYPIEIAYWDSATARCGIWARISALPEQDALLLWQCGGTGPSFAPESTWSNCYGTDNDYAVVYHFEEASGTTARDASGGYDGTITGCALGATGQIGNCFDFEATDAEDCVSNADACDFEHTQPFTTMAWVDREDAANSRFVMARRNNLGAAEGWSVHLKATSSEIAQLLVHDNGSVERIYVESDARADIDKLVFVATTYDGSGTAADAGVAFYCDGAPGGIHINDDALASKSILTSAEYCVGSRNNADLWWDGLIDEPRVYKGVLPPAAVREHYQNEYSPASAAITGAGGEIKTGWLHWLRFHFGWMFGF